MSSTKILSGDSVIVDKPVVVFDGSCGLCNSIVRFLIRLDDNKKLLFSPSDSAFVQNNITSDVISLLDSTILFVYKEKYYYKSDAAIAIIRALGLPGWVTFTLRSIPRFIRDYCYNFIARRRKLLFGEDRCDVEHPATRDRFIL